MTTLGIIVEIEKLSNYVRECDKLEQNEQLIQINISRELLLVILRAAEEHFKNKE